MWRAGFRDIDIQTVWSERARQTLSGAVKDVLGRAFPGVREILVAEAGLDAAET
jgi:hypothetical protein